MVNTRCRPDSFASVRPTPPVLREPWGEQTTPSTSWTSSPRAARDTDDWGLVADLARFRATSEQLTTFDTTIRGLKNSREAAVDQLAAISARLACAQADQCLASL
jgi:hypothetical protein